MTALPDPDADSAVARSVTFGRPLIEQASIDEVVDSLRSGWIGAGPKVARFEQLLQGYLGVANVICVSSATAGMSLTLRALGIGAGDEVLVPTMTFVASAQAIEYTGARPVLVDCEPGTHLISVERARAAITSRTRAIMAVHLAGRPADLVELGRLRQEYGLLVIEDAAHAIGARLDERPIGAWDNPAVFSFGPGKNITSIEGGAVAASDPLLAERVRRLSRHGVDRSAWQRFSADEYEHYDVALPGFKFNLTDVQAAVALHQLPRLDAWIERRERLWETYDAAFAELPLELPAPVGTRVRHARHLYQVLVQDASPITRDQLAARLRSAGIGTGIHYRALHLHSHFRDRYELAPGDFPVATDASGRLLSLPLDATLSDSDQTLVISTLTAILNDG